MVGWWVSRPDFSRLLMSVGYGRGIEEDGRAGLCDAVLARLEMQLEHLADKAVPAFRFMAASKILGEEAAANAAGPATATAGEKGSGKRE